MTPDDGRGVRHGPQDPRYFDKGRTGRDWNLATAMVINGKAGMQFMGDWAKGEFLARTRSRARTTSARRCRARPRTTRSTSTRSCSSSRRAKANAGQLALAKTIMSPAFQEQFSLNKGSIPVRLGVKMAKFDDCAKESSMNLTPRPRRNTLCRRSLTAWLKAAAAGAINDVVTKFMNDAGIEERRPRSRRPPRRSNRPRRSTSFSSSGHSPRAFTRAWRFLHLSSLGSRPAASIRLLGPGPCLQRRRRK